MRIAANNLSPRLCMIGTYICVLDAELLRCPYEIGVIIGHCSHDLPFANAKIPLNSVKFLFHIVIRLAAKQSKAAK